LTQLPLKQFQSKYYIFHCIRELFPKWIETSAKAKLGKWTLYMANII